MMRTTRFDTAPGRPLWLTTLADISLLLVGFFVFLQAAQAVDRRALTTDTNAVRQRTAIQRLCGPQAHQEPDQQRRDGGKR